MDTLELTVSSLDEAIKQACDQWGTSADELSTKILDESPGLFGKKKIKVLVEKKAKKAASRAKAPKAAAPEPEVEAPAEVKAKPVKAPRAKKVAEPEASADAAAAEAPSDRVDFSQVVATEQDAEQAASVLRELLELADLEVEVKVKEITGRYVYLELDGTDTAHVVGKSGEVLNHLQYLMNVMLSRKISTGVRVTLDGNNYRERREEKLKQLAEHVAAQVIERQEEAVFDALPAFERRVVHKVLAEIDGVTTYSEGEEPNRRVVIAPVG